MGVNGFIKKPYSLIILAQEIKKLIQEKEEAGRSGGDSAPKPPSIRDYEEETISHKVSASGTVILKQPVSASGTAILKAHEVPIPENKK